MGEIGKNPTLGEAAARYLASLTPEEREASQQEVNRFVRWYGWEKPVAQLTLVGVANYAERIAAATPDPQRMLEPVHRFLTFARSQKLVSVNLAAQLRVKKGVGKAIGGGHGVRAATLTAQGRKELKEELAGLQRERHQVLAEVKRAREDKDFRENAPLEAARERLAQTESRTKEIEALLAGARLAETPPDSKAGLGATVTLTSLTLGQNFTYALVDPSETNPAKGKISVTSPLGKALLGKQAGEEVEVTTPGGSHRYRVQSVS